MPDVHKPATVLVAGATGYVGGRLVPELLEHGHRVRCLARQPQKLAGVPWTDRGETVRADIETGDGLANALQGVDAAYYLVHSIGNGGDWERRDALAALRFREAAEVAGVRQIVYLGGLGNDTGSLSAHLASRHEVGRVLAAGRVPVTELRAAVVIGSGSASFEMLRHLVDVLPAMVTPRWVRTRCQPIAIRDVLGYLTGVLLEPKAFGRVFEIGGADVVTYADMMALYAQLAGLRRRIVVPVPVLSPRLSSWWIRIVTPLPVDLARALVDSLVNEVIVHDGSIGDIVPLEPLSTRDAIEFALRRVADLDVETTWAGTQHRGHTPADPMPGDPAWSGGTMLEDRRAVVTDASPEAVFAVVSGIGGDRGWYAAQALWWIRGALDVLVGGVGLRRGRRHPDELRVGDPLDFWRVEAIEPNRLLRLRAEMLLPGDAWLEWRISTDPDGRTRLEQLARFHPRGLFGRAYWYAVMPFHVFVFGPLVRRLAAAAERHTNAQRSSKMTCDTLPPSPTEPFETSRKPLTNA